ncbi:methionine--tRNA ligase [Nonlabens ponticola]|uniref:Methionine--tRNA ligase n=1 Tax=Nonlabens ponticola TaxID=2496866 RepID=A0A3S9MV17_9FLAO|nr:methionine--tRNA ligase [Nonlabens ponticola]AZQ43026.1 methionine--tRNA ligase [Nonlabens ponticola]
MSNQQRYTITAALPYTNGPVHIGHLAGVYVPADIYARYQRLKGSDVAFICGSDEHGVPITLKAKKEGVTPQEIVDRYHKIIGDSFEEFGISFDNYSRTSAQVHHETASQFFLKLYEDGKFVEQVTEQLYDKEADQFLADRFVIGTCPKCGNPESYGDQCERCGTSHNATDLIEPKSAITGNVPELRETKHWFLPLDQYSDFLNEWIVEGHADDWKTNVLGQVKGWITDGLKPRAVTRDLDWGIPVPVEGADGKVLYVWFDAPIGYISSTKEWASREGKNWEDYWKNEDTKLLHFIGKDNIVFHCIIFPAMLKAHGDFILPDNVPANEFLNLEDDKISTSRNWAVWLHEYLQDFPGQQDVLRYVLTANAPETKDNNFTWKDFQARNNNELVAILGNFINRALVLTHKYYDGVVPQPGEFTQVDQETLDAVNAFPASIESSLERYRFRESANEFMNLARLGNKYLADEEPWKLIKTDPERVKTIMFIGLQIAGALAVLAEPFLPHTAGKLQDMLNIASNPAARLRADLVKIEWNDIAQKQELLHHGYKINKAELLFSKIEDEQIEAQLQKLEATKAANQITTPNLMPQKEETNYDDFMKMDLRVAEILTAEKLPKSNKLMVMTVDTGIDKRTIVSGIAKHFTADELIGRKVTVLANLAPRKLMGVESQGMILLAEDPDGKLVFVNPDDAVVNGATIA